MSPGASVRAFVRSAELRKRGCCSVRESTADGCGHALQRVVDRVPGSPRLFGRTGEDRDARGADARAESRGEGFDGRHEEGDDEGAGEGEPAMRRRVGPYGQTR